MFNKKNNETEAPFAAGMNFDIEEVEPFLQRLSISVLESSLSKDEIHTITSEIISMNKNNDIKEIGTFEVNYKGTPSKIRIETEIHIEDGNKEAVLYMYSHQELVDRIDEEMIAVDEERNG
ncbi:hypothetical protein ACFQPF_08185 [Fictibacillus iocasae]|uniref:Uncharacterized protein n=1 Tax=Fictibacillus iocasae TaxID=2715437 RepID=A0ABW2NQZ7_9BACL